MPAPDPSLQSARTRGWAHLVDRLVADGVDRRQVARAFADPRMPSFDGMEFRVPRPGRGGGGHGGGVSSAEVAGARRCRAQHARAFEETEARSGVPASVIAALLQVETGCGRNTGTHRVLPALARLAMANEPDNLSMNVSLRTRQADDGEEAGDVAQRVKSRARYLEKTFYPEVKATFEAARRMGVTEVVFLRQPDGELEPTIALREKIVRMVRTYLPDVVLTHDPFRAYAFHPDHRAVGYATTDSVYPTARDPLYFSHHLTDEGLTTHKTAEIWYFGAEHPDLIVDITDTFATKMHALKAHVSQVGDGVAMEERMAERARELAKGSGYEMAEAFKVVQMRR